MTANEIKHIYSNWQPEQGVDELLALRKHLSLVLYEMSCDMAELEEKSKYKENERKIEQAIKELDSNETTASARKQSAIKHTRHIMEDEGRLEGKLRGYKIQFEALQNMSHSMASYLNKM